MEYRSAVRTGTESISVLVATKKIFRNVAVGALFWDFPVSVSKIVLPNPQIIANK